MFLFEEVLGSLGTLTKEVLKHAGLPEGIAGGSPVRAAFETSASAWEGTQRAQYPLNKEHTLNYRGLNLMV